MARGMDRVAGPSSGLELLACARCRSRERVLAHARAATSCGYLVHIRAQSRGATLPSGATQGSGSRPGSREMRADLLQAVGVTPRFSLILA